jgi:hypothetical protein
MATSSKSASESLRKGRLPDAPARSRGQPPGGGGRGVPGPPSRAAAEPARLATGLLATLDGGMALSQVRKDMASLRIAAETGLAQVQARQTVVVGVVPLALVTGSAQADPLIARPSPDSRGRKTGPHRTFT